LNGRRLDKLNNLVGTVSQPFLRSDGSLVTTEGYDKQSELYASFDAGQYTVPEHPAEADAKGALDELHDILAEFPFDKPHDRSAALAGILTATVRASLPTAPMFHVKANTPGSGKSFLCSLFSFLPQSNLRSPHRFLRPAMNANIVHMPWRNNSGVADPWHRSAKLKCEAMAITREWMDQRKLRISRTPNRYWYTQRPHRLATRSCGFMPGAGVRGTWPWHLALAPDKELYAR